MDTEQLPIFIPLGAAMLAFAIFVLYFEILLQS